MNIIKSFDPGAFKDTLFPRNSEPVIYETFDGEQLCIAIGQPDPETVQVYERSEGPLTFSVYESPWHAARVTLSAEALRDYYSSSTTAEAISNTALFFLLPDDYRMPEFLDFLDDNFIPYTYEFEDSDAPVETCPGGT